MTGLAAYTLSPLILLALFCGAEIVLLLLYVLLPLAGLALLKLTGRDAEVPRE